MTVPYRLVLPLDRGGRFEVWRIEPARSSSGPMNAVTVEVPVEFAGPPLALKCVAPGMARDGTEASELQNEATLQAEIVHPGIVPVALTTLEGLPAIVAPLAAGSVETITASGGATPIDGPIAELVLLASALAALHAAGIVHGDVAPSNVLSLETDDLPLGLRRGLALSDFGNARRLADDSGADAPVLGTPGAVAPEVVTGAPPDPASDVFGLGRVAHCWLESGAVADLDVAASIEAWCRRLSDPDPTLRPSAAEAVTLLRRSPRTVEFGPRPVSSADSDPLGTRRTWFAPRSIALTVSAAVLLVLGVAQFGRGGDATPPPRAGSNPDACVPSPSAGLLPRGRTRMFDVLGTGCAQTVAWTGDVLVVERGRAAATLRYRFGKPGDRVAVGQWGCAGQTRPVIYRPDQGLLLRYRALPTETGSAGAVPPISEAGLPHDGRVVLGRDARGCAVVTIRTSTTRGR